MSLVSCVIKMFGPQLYTGKKTFVQREVLVCQWMSFRAGHFVRNFRGIQGSIIEHV